MPIDIVCPSGLAGTVRGFKAKEAAMLADRKALREGQAYDTILSACWLATKDVGPYPFLKKQDNEEGSGELLQRIDWPRILICDRFWTLLKIRAASYGDNYEFTVPCGSSDCREKIEWQLNLSELPWKALPETSRAQLLAGKNEFTTTLPDGAQCRFRLQTGSGEVAASQMLFRAGAQQGMGRGKALINVLASRIIEIDRLGPKKPVRKKDEVDPYVEYLGDLDMTDLIELTETLDEADGGVETTIEVECQACMTIQKVELPLGVEFFLPKKRKKDSETTTPAATSQSEPGSSPQ